jgi:outer membrane protein TolC
MRLNLSILFSAISLLGTSSLWSAYTLEEAELLALKHNPQLRSAKELIEAARYGRADSFSKWLPQLSVISYAFKVQKPIFLLLPNSTTAFETQIQLTQQIFSSDVYRNIKLASLYVKQFDFLYDAAVNDVLFQVRQAYYRIVLDYKNIDTTKEHIKLMTEIAQEIEDKHKIGTAILFNVNQAKVAIANATKKYYEQIAQLKNDYDFFLQLIGTDPSKASHQECHKDEEKEELKIHPQEIPIFEISEIAHKLKEADAVFSDLKDMKPIFSSDFPESEAKRLACLFSNDEIIHWRKLADHHRPDLLLSHNYIELADETLRKQQGNYLPSLGIVGNYGGGSTPFIEVPSSHFDNQKFEWGVGLQLNWLLFDSLGREHRIRQAKSEKNARRFNYTQTLFAAHSQVQDQIHNIEASIASYVTSLSNVKLAEQNVELARDQFKIGYIIYLDYKTAVDGLVQARDIYHRACYDLIVFYYGLRHASGVDVSHLKKGK